MTGLRQKIANYPGITVERKVGTSIIGGVLHQIIDLPGAYSLNYKKLDERIAYQALIGSYEHEEKPDLVLAVVDVTNLDRNLFLVSQLLDLEIPVILVLNMMDVAEQKQITINEQILSENLGIPVISISAKKREDIERLKQFVAKAELSPPSPLAWLDSFQLRQALGKVKKEWIQPHTNIPESATH